MAFEGVRGNGDVSFRSDTPESASGFREAACQMVGQEGLWIMSNGTVSGDLSHSSGAVPDTREPSGREGPDVPAALRAAVMAKTGEPEGN